VAAKATSAAAAAAKEGGGRDRNPFGSDDDDDDDDEGFLEVFGKKSTPDTGRPPSKSKTGKASGGQLGGRMSGTLAPDRWSETQMASETERAAGAIFLEEEVGTLFVYSDSSGVIFHVSKAHDFLASMSNYSRLLTGLFCTFVSHGIRKLSLQRGKAMAERQKAEEEKRRLLGRDPLGIHGTGDFDLQEIEDNREGLIRQTLQEIEAEIELEASSASESGVEKINWLEAQRQSLLAIVEAKKRSDAGKGGSESKGEGFPSILPTSPDFDAILFLTLVHRHASYQELLDSISRLSRRTDNQVERLQNFVRDNFALFIKCSEGIDIFADQGGSQNSRRQLQNQFGTLDNIAQSCSEQARKSFKPLLDNTNEVRKVQSALAVLQRIAPLLQIPSLMRQHIENANFSSMVKAYRKVLGTLLLVFPGFGLDYGRIPFFILVSYTQRTYTTFETQQ
jgi:hypothetical protein